jgi:hypothetical protein
MNGINRIFNKSFNDLHFLQNSSFVSEKYVFVFDFDLTLTTKSSDNLNYTSNYIELFDSEDKLEKLKYYLNKIYKFGYPIYINTRALITDVKHILNKVGLNVGKNQIIKEIKGSESIKLINEPFDINDLNKYNLTNITDPKILWAVKKVTILNRIAEQEEVPINKILFFDDSVVNINTAKINGYNNSFLIGSNDSGIIGLDYLLIKLDQIFEIILK